MHPRSQICFRPIAVAPALAVLSGCATHLLRFDEPARQEDVALSARADEPDLVLLDVVGGVLPKDAEKAIVEISRADGAPLLLVVRGKDLTERERRFVSRKPSAWTRAVRAERNLLVAADLAEGERRDYRVRCVPATSGGFELVVARTLPAPAVELGRLRLPEALTPPELSGAERIALGIPLAVLDLAWIPICAVSFVMLLPFGSWAAVEDLADDETR